MTTLHHSQREGSGIMLTEMSFLDALLTTMDDPRSHRHLLRQRDQNGHKYYIDNWGNRKYDKPVFINNILYREKNTEGHVISQTNNQRITQYFRELPCGTWTDGPDEQGFTHYRDDNGVRFRIHNKGTLHYVLNEGRDRITYVLPDDSLIFYKCGGIQCVRNTH